MATAAKTTTAMFWTGRGDRRKMTSEHYGAHIDMDRWTGSTAASLLRKHLKDDHGVAVVGLQLGRTHHMLHEGLRCSECDAVLTGNRSDICRKCDAFVNGR